MDTVSCTHRSLDKNFEVINLHPMREEPREVLEVTQWFLDIKYPTYTGAYERVFFNRDGHESYTASWWDAKHRKWGVDSLNVDDALNSYMTYGPSPHQSCGEFRSVYPYFSWRGLPCNPEVKDLQDRAYSHMFNQDGLINEFDDIDTQRLKLQQITVPYMTDWEMTFGTTKNLLLYELVPDEFKNPSKPTKWGQLTKDTFYCGVYKLVLHPKDGVNPEKAWRHIIALLASISSQHTQKKASVAYLMSLYFIDATWEVST